MALIICPKCEKEISDKAKKCPACGFELIVENPKEMLKCEECGAEILEGMDICQNCGCPVENQEKVQTRKEEFTGVVVSKRIIKIIVVGIVAIIAATAIVVFVNQQKKIAEQRLVEESIAQREKEEEEAFEEYGSTLEMAVYSMLLGAATAEEAGELIHDVWYNTIYEESDSITNKYTKKSNGAFYDDFNDALANLFADTDFISKLDNIQTNQETVKQYMKELTAPPEEYSDAYDVLKEYYDAYLELTNLVLNPKGNLQTYTSNFNDADSTVLKYYEAMQLYIEE